MKYKNDDYELLYLVSENNEEAKDILYKKYENLVSIKVKRNYPFFKKYGVDYNDLLQEGMLGFIKAINKYQDNKNTEFATFANKCIDLQLKTYKRTISNNKHRALNTSISVNNTEEEEKSIINFIKDKADKNPETMVFNREKIKDINKVIDTKLTDLEKKVLLLKSSGCSHKEISEKLNITVKSAEHAYKRAKNKLENVK